MSYRIKRKPNRFKKFVLNDEENQTHLKFLNFKKNVSIDDFDDIATSLSQHFLRKFMKKYFGMGQYSNYHLVPYSTLIDLNYSYNDGQFKHLDGTIIENFLHKHKDFYEVDVYILYEYNFKKQYQKMQRIHAYLKKCGFDKELRTKVFDLAIFKLNQIVLSSLNKFNETMPKTQKHRVEEYNIIQNRLNFVTEILNEFNSFLLDAYAENYKDVKEKYIDIKKTYQVPKNLNYFRYLDSIVFFDSEPINLIDLPSKIRTYIKDCEFLKYYNKLYRVETAFI